MQWLNARAPDPDVLQLDVVWTAEFAAAGWISSLDRFQPDTGRLLSSAPRRRPLARALYALPWFIDVGMLYWRTDLMAARAAHFDELTAAVQSPGPSRPLRLVWQGARYEGLVTVFVEYLGAFGGGILDVDGRVVVDSGAGRPCVDDHARRDRRSGIVPTAVLSWQEEETRFAFQNGEAALMRNWPYAYRAAGDAASRGWPGSLWRRSRAGRRGAALGGSKLAINANSKQPDEAYALVEYLMRPEQMIERAAPPVSFRPRARCTTTTVSRTRSTLAQTLRGR